MHKTLTRHLLPDMPRSLNVLPTNTLQTQHWIWEERGMAMVYQSSEARVLDEPSYGYAPSRLNVLEGGGLDQMARRAASPVFLKAAICAVVLTVTLFVVGSLSIALTSGSVSILQSNASLSSKIDQTEEANADLRVACSLLSSYDRIGRIATQNLDMVYANEVVHLDV